MIVIFLFSTLVMFMIEVPNEAGATQVCFKLILSYKTAL